MRSLAYVLATALTFAGPLGCDTPREGATDAAVGVLDPADPAVARFPSARLPITLPAQYVQHGRRLFHRGAVAQGTTFELRTPLVEVVALADLIVVIDGPGLRVTWAGAGDPTWRSTSLEGALRGPGLLTADVADLDAVASPDFADVHLVVRDTAGTIVHAVWHPEASAGGVVLGGAVLEASAVRPALTPGREPAWYRDQCEDLALAFSPDGHLDLAFQGGSLRRPRGAREWGAGVFRSPFDACHQKITYDDASLGLLLGVSRPEALFADGPAGPSLVQMPEGEHNTVAVFREGNRPGAPGGLEQIPDPAITGRVVLDRHPDGFALMGIATAINFGSWIEPFSPRGLFENRASGPSVPHPWSYECTGCGDAAWARESTGIIRNGCGSVTTFTALGGGHVPPFVEAPLLLTSNTAPAQLDSELGGGGFTCHTTARAPAIWHPEAALHAIYDIRFAHGRRPYNVGLCVSPEGAMSVCLGGLTSRFDTRDHPQGALHDAALVVEVVDSSIPDRGVLGRDTEAITLTLSALNEHLRANLWDVTLGTKAAGVVERRPAERQIVLRPRNRTPDHTYRLEIYDDRLSTIATWGARQAFEYVAEGDAPPRHRPWPLACPERVAGVCTVRDVPPDPRRPGQGAPNVTLDLTGPERRRRGPSTAELLGVETAEGAPVAAHGALTPDGALQITFPEGLAPQTTYTLTLGPVIDADGRSMNPNDQIVRLVSGGEAPLAAPTVVATAPADGATGVPTERPALAAEFDGPIDLASLEAVTLAPEDAPGAPVALAVVADGAHPERVVFTPGADLQPRTAYRWTLPAGLTRADAAGGLASAEAVVITFTTGEAPVVELPTVVATTPADGAMDVPRGQALRVEFSLPMAVATLADGVRLAPEATPEAPIALSAVPDGPTAFRLLHAPLTADTRYALILGPPLASAPEAGGGALAAETRLTFTTGGD